MNPKKPLYNSRVLNVYIKFLGERYPEISITDILAYANIDFFEISDEGHWFTQEQADRFYKRVVTLTGNKNIAREAGRFSASPGAVGTLRQYTLGLLGPAKAFQVINTMAKKLTASSEYHSRQIGPAR